MRVASVNTRTQTALVTIAVLVLFTGIAAAETGDLTLFDQINSFFQDIVTYFENLDLLSTQSEN